MTRRCACRLVLAATCALAVLLPVRTRAGDAEEFAKLAKQFDADLAADRYEAAEKVVREMLVIAERVGERYPAILALCLHNLGIVCDEQGHYAEAIPAYQRALSIREKAFGPEHVSVADTLANLATTYYHLERYAEAEPLSRRALAIKEKALGPEDLETIAMVSNLAILCEAKQSYEEAERLFKRALDVQKRASGAEHPDVAETLQHLGHVYEATRRYSEAETAYRKSLEIWRKTLGAEDRRVAAALGSLAGLYSATGRYAEAEQLHQEVAKIRTKGKGPAEAAEEMANSASVLQRQGRYAEAESMNRQSLAALEKSRGPEDPSLVVVLNNLAVLYDDQGRYAEAEVLFKRALAIQEKVFGPDHPPMGRELSNLANVYKRQKRYAEASDLYLRALKLKQKAFGREHPEVAATLNSMGGLFMAVHKYEEAATAYRLALTIWYKTLGENHPDMGQGISNLALTYAARKDYAEAMRLYQDALKVWEKALGPNHPDVGSCAFNMSLVYYDQGRYAEALPLTDRAVAIFDRSAPSPGDRCQAYYLRAQIRWHLQQPDVAVSDLRKAIELGEQQRASFSGAEQQRAQAFSQFGHVFECMVRWQTERGDLNEALNAMERSRARTLFDQMECHGTDLLSGLSEQDAGPLRRRVAAVEQRLARLQSDARNVKARKELSENDVERKCQEIQAEMERACAEYAAVYADIRTASPSYRLATGKDQKPVTLERLKQWTTGCRGLLLEYLLGKEGGYLLVIRPDGAVRLKKLEANDTQAKSLHITAGPITVETLGHVLSDQQETGVLQLLQKPDDPATDAALAALYEVLIPADERAIIESGKCDRLIIVPDGPLASLPFETLAIPGDAQRRCLIDVGPPCLYSPSATILLNLSERPAAAQGAAAVLTVGEPRYGQSAEASRGGLSGGTPSSRYMAMGGSLAELPFTKWETEWVADVFREKGIEVRQLLGDNATEAHLRSECHGPSVIHAACHGLVDQAHGNLFGALALTPGPDPSPADDGFLTLAEIYEMDLRRCEIAILSACQTNYGPQQEGEGVWALSRGFLVAGSRRVVASNWLVDDEAAASLVSYFCSLLAARQKDGNTLDYARALQQAKRFVREQEKWKSPYYWGTFVLVGPN